MQALIITAQREHYSATQCKTMNVRELIECLEQYDDDLPVILSHDNGYTYGGVRESLIDIDYVNED